MYRFDIKVPLIGLLVLTVQIGTANFLEIAGARPDLLLIYLLLICYRYGSLVGLFAGFLCGFAYDFTATGYWGVYALSMSTLGFWAGKLVGRNELFTRLGIWVTLIFLSHLSHEFLASLFLLFGTDKSLFGYLVRVILPDTVYTSVVGLLIGILVLSYVKKQVHLNPVRPKSKVPRNKPVLRD